MNSKYFYFISFIFCFNIINCLKIKDPKKFISDVIIDLNGNYKYIVRGSNEFEYHKKLYLNFMRNNVYKYPDIINHFSFKILGGGRISVNSNNITVYGSSGYYGTANHKLTCNLIKLAYPSYNCIAL